MRRFVTYIYEYEKGIRGRNVGFIRTDIRDDYCRMEIHIRGLERFRGKGTVYLVVNDRTPMGIPAAEILIGQGMGHLKLACPHNQIGKSGYSVNQLQALVIRYGGGKMLAGCFVNEPSDRITKGDFEIWGEKQPDNTSGRPELPQDTASQNSELQEISSSDSPDSGLQETSSSASSGSGLQGNSSSASPGSGLQENSSSDSLNSGLQETSSSASSGSGLQETSSSASSGSGLSKDISLASASADSTRSVPPASEPSTMPEDDMQRQRGTQNTERDKPRISYQKIEITDIRKLPKRNWHLCNNSFLVHGFFNYHYLILKTVSCQDKTERYLGVPGIYEQPERMMALLFGFPEFEAVQSGSDSQTTNAQRLNAASTDASGTFGYWMCRLSED